MNYPEFTKEHKSLMAKYLTKEIFEELKEKKTKNGANLANIINSGVKNPDSGIGAYAGDEESYSVFAPLFDKIIEEYHGYEVTQKHQSDLDISHLNAPKNEDFDKYIVSTRIRVGRNIQDLPLGSMISKEQILEVEEQVSKVLLNMEGNLKGKYFSLNNLEDKDKEELIKDHFLFKAGDRFLEAAGLNRDWPNGRGIFHNSSKTFLVWINEEDQLRIISMEKGGDIVSVFGRLVDAIKQLEQHITFSFNDHLGYITSCPTNLGTALRASVHIKLPNLENNMELFNKICDKNHLQIRGINGEHSQSSDSTFDISNKRRLGVTEIQCVQDMYNGVVELIEAEKKETK